MRKIYWLGLFRLLNFNKHCKYSYITSFLHPLLLFDAAFTYSIVIRLLEPSVRICCLGYKFHVCSKILAPSKTFRWILMFGILYFMFVAKFLLWDSTKNSSERGDTILIIVKLALRLVLLELIRYLLNVAPFDILFSRTVSFTYNEVIQ